MTVLPSQKLSIGELCVAIGAGLMLFLLPNDAKNTFQDETMCESFVFILTIVITVVFHLIIKRFEAVGAMMLTASVMISISVAFNIVTGAIAKGSDYWPNMQRYRIITMMITWLVPFIYVVIRRLLSGRTNDNSDIRRSFARFLALSIRAMIIIYLLVIIFKLLIPVRPQMDSEREVLLIPTQLISNCFSGEYDRGVEYLIWTSLIIAPMTFYLSVLVKNFHIWHALIISAAVGLTIEALQFILNTSVISTDDIIMYLIGAVIGVLAKFLIDALRNLITIGKETTILSYNPDKVVKKSSGEAEIIEEE